MWELIVTALLVGLVTFLYIKYSFSYWNRKGVPCMVPDKPWGSLTDLIFQRKSIGHAFADKYHEMSEKGWKFGGLYTFLEPIFIPVDLDIVKFIMTKDFNNFHSRGIYHNEEADPLSGNLFTLEGSKWKSLRAKLSPTFTSGKMKMMFPIIVNCSKHLTDVVESSSKASEPVDIKDVAGRMTTDVIGSCAFGLDCNSLKDPDSEFRKYGKLHFMMTKYEALRNIFILSAPKLMKKLNVRFIKKEVSDFFFGVVKNTINYRKQNNVGRKDFMSLLIKLMEEEGAGGLTLNEIAAQAFVFYNAGFETSSSTMTFCLYELSQNQEIQDRLREEILSTLNETDGELTYEAVMGMKYMDQVVNETLRKYPPLPFLNRKCNEPIHIPGTEIVLEKGTTILISNLGIHKDPKIYPDPEKFDPDRFSQEEKEKRHGHSHLPFGEGPRICIGMRFGYMQTKVGLSSLLSKFKFSIHPKTKLPLTFEPKNFILSFREDLYLIAEKL